MAEPKVTELPRKAFDTVEAPVADASESLLERDAFMDVLAFSWKVQRGAARRVGWAASRGLRLFGVSTRADTVELVNQVAGLQREVRELRRELEAR